MKTIRNLLDRCLRYRSFRILMANLFPFLKRFKIINLIHKLNKGSFSDPYDIVEGQDIGVFRTYDIDTNKLGSVEKFHIDFRRLIKIEKDYTIGFVMNPDNYGLNNIKSACNILGVQYIIYNIKNPSLYREIVKSVCDGIFIYPVSDNNIIRNVFHEAAQILSSETKLNIYPSLRELNIYESKRTLANFLAINDIPHPATSVFYEYESAKNFLEVSKFPVVFKTHIGASASGVEILKNKKQALKLARQLFFKYYLRKMEIEKRSIEWGYMLLQEYIDEVKEYRVIKIGDSWFGYQKWKNQNQIFLSGSGMCRMINPREEVLNFCYNIAVKYHFTTMCFDIFENKQGQFLVNELQTWFGSYDPTEMYVDNIPGRYCRLDGKWIFEPGFYNIYGSILLRLTHMISLLQQE